MLLVLALFVAAMMGCHPLPVVYTRLAATRPPTTVPPSTSTTRAPVPKPTMDPQAVQAIGLLELLVEPYLRQIRVNDGTVSPEYSMGLKISKNNLINLVYFLRQHMLEESIHLVCAFTLFAEASRLMTAWELADIPSAWDHLLTESVRDESVCIYHSHFYRAAHALAHSRNMFLVQQIRNEIYRCVASLSLLRNVHISSERARELSDMIDDIAASPNSLLVHRDSLKNLQARIEVLLYKEVCAWIRYYLVKLAPFLVLMTYPNGQDLFLLTRGARTPIY